MIRGGPMSRLLAGRTLWLLIGLIALIEAIFLAESFTTLMEIVVSNGGSVFDTGLLLILKSPQIVDFALPLVLLIGLYFAIIAAREDNEFIVCAAAGVPWTQIPGFAIKVGLAGFVVSVIFAGYLTPMANYLQRLEIRALESRRALAEITEPAPKSSLRRIQDRTVIATPPTSPDAERGTLFIFEPDNGAGWRVSQAEDWTVVGPASDGGYSILLKSFRDYAGVSGSEGAAEPRDDDPLRTQLQRTRMTVKSLALDFRIESVVSAIDETRRAHEQVLVSWADVAGPGTPGNPVIDRRLGEVLARGLLCLFAALAAVAAAAWAGTRGGRYLALPVSAVSVLGGDIVIRTVLGDAAAAGAQMFWPTFAIAAAASVALPMIYIGKRRETMIAPGRSRA